MKDTIFFDTSLDAGAPAGTASHRRVYSRAFKRVADIALAILLFPIVAPTVLVLAALVARDGGSPFFNQKRVGRHGQVFTCYKLRTMVHDAEAKLQELIASDPEVAQEWHAHQKLKKDPRITLVGRFLRKTSLDELPQLLNVLKGDMSFVGPRPFMLDQEEMYREAGGNAYFRMRPGITGSWQIEGRNATRFVDRVHFDESYYREVSFLRDAKLILSTALVVVRPTGH